MTALLYAMQNKGRAENYGSRLSLPKVKVGFFIYFSDSMSKVSLDLAWNVSRNITKYFPICDTEELFRFVTEFILSSGSSTKKCLQDQSNIVSSREKVTPIDLVNDNANIAILSIVLGVIEHSLTGETHEPKNENKFASDNFPKYKAAYTIPPVELDVVMSLYDQFQTVIYSYVDLSDHISSQSNAHIHSASYGVSTACPVSNLADNGYFHSPMESPDPLLEDVDSVNNNRNPKKFFYATKRQCNLEGPNLYCNRNLLKSVSDAIWVRLQKSYQKDRSHQQSVFSFLTTWRLDSFGVAVCVVAAAQLLGLKDVHLALSEDHAWVTFGENQSESAEVTWHGKAVEDKRGDPITETVAKKRWLYLGGNNAIKCSRPCEVAACIASMNMSMGFGNERTDNSVVAFIQQKLLWHMYYQGLLDNYPTCIALLGDLEDIQPYESSDKSPLELYQSAIKASITYYADSFVYPYIHLGKHCLRKHKLRESLANWARAATVIGQYNYDKEEEEIYREFFDIATVHIPSVVKRSLTPDSSQLVCDDIFSLCYIAQFLDGICCWEEGSSTPVLHITWAERFLPVFSAFPYDVRKRITYILPELSSESHRVETKCSNEETRLNNSGNNSSLSSPNNCNSSAPSKSCSSMLSDQEVDLSIVLQEMSHNMFSPLCHLGAPNWSVQPAHLRVTNSTNKIEMSIMSKKMALITELIQNEKFNPHTANLQLTAQTSLNSERKRVKHNPYVDFTYLTSKRKK